MTEKELHDATDGSEKRGSWRVHTAAAARRRRTRAGFRSALLALAVLSWSAALPGRATALTTAGFELDALPFATGGYSGQIWAGVAPVRLRIVRERTFVPDFLVDAGFRNLRIDATAYIVDLFVGEGASEFRGYWLGLGSEKWNCRIEEETSGATQNFSNDVATFAGGYVWKFSGNWSLNPWAAIHQITGGDRRIPVGGKIYEPPAQSFTVSVKLGWHF